MIEQAVVFQCQGQRLVGVVTAPEAPPDTALLIVVGGPQYRAGSHRQFVQLARRAAEHGFAAMRFDTRGMGDSEGAQRSFEEIDEDLAAAIDALQRAVPSVRRVGLWGLCGGASASLLYCRKNRDPRVAGLALINPWVRSETTQALTRVKHYYLQRLLQAQFWKKLFSGRVAFTAIKELSGAVRVAVGAVVTVASGEVPNSTLERRMAEGLANLSGEVLIILSGNDYTAKEFLEAVSLDNLWQVQLARQRLTRVDIREADHTFSQTEWQQKAEAASVEWLERLSLSASG